MDEFVDLLDGNRPFVGGRRRFLTLALVGVAAAAVAFVVWTTVAARERFVSGRDPRPQSPSQANSQFPSPANSHKHQSPPVQKKVRFASTLNVRRFDTAASPAPASPAPRPRDRAGAVQPELRPILKRA